MSLKSFVHSTVLALTCVGLVLTSIGLATAQGIAPIPRRVPPIGLEIPQSLKDTSLKRLAELSRELATVRDNPLAADVDVLLKAVQLAIKHREIYKAAQFERIGKMLDLADERLKQIESDDVPDWTNRHLVVRGFYSRIDDSAQPYGLVIPKNLPKDEPVPLYVWLHGRGDKTTDIHFIQERLTKVGQISPPNAIVLHPFGRQCIGFKSAGETDVLEAIAHVTENYPIDENRIVLMGFSMGGAGAWHLGAHYTDRFVAVSPGAGFAETAMYQKYSAERIAATPDYERRLWGVYDVPNYVRNLFNVPVVCYSGEKDKQIQAARVMEAAYERHGKTLDHVIGPEMGHKYDAESLTKIMSKMEHAVQAGRTVPNKVHLQTQTLRYSRMHWIQIDRLEKHWADSRIDAQRVDDTIVCQTKNITQFQIHPVPHGAKKLVVDEIEFQLDADERTVVSRKADEKSWRIGVNGKSTTVAKRPGLQGPIDDAFLERFLVVTPTKPFRDSVQDRWTQFELQHLRDRWSALFRGQLPEKAADEVSSDDIRHCNLILFGNVDNNPLVKQFYTSVSDEFRTQLAQQIEEGGVHCVPQLIYPNPSNPQKYVVLNSGPTFREAHDKTNSLQNPKLPDWAIIDLRTPPDGERSGKVVNAGFFDENWQFQ